MNINLHYDRRFNAEGACAKIVDQVHQASLTSAIARSFSCPYELSNDQYNHLSQAISPRLLRISDHASLHPHPVPACLQILAYQRSNEYARHFRSPMDIGGNTLRTNPRHHICALISTAREKARYMNAAFCQMNGGDITNVHPHGKGVIMGLNTSCTRGADKCTRYADYAYMINVYDIPIESIPLIMSKHRTKVLDAWMFLPNSLLDYRMRTDETFYTTNILKHVNFKQRIIRFNFGCSSTNYEHNYDDLKKYMTTTYIRHGTGGVFVEHIERYHTFTRIRFTWTNIKENLHADRSFLTDDVEQLLGIVIPNVLDYASYSRTVKLIGSDDYYVVPNIVAHLRIGLGVDKVSNQTIYAKKHVVVEAMNYVQRQADNSYNYSSFCSHIQGKMTGLLYLNNGSKQFVYKTTDIEPHVFNQLTISLFIIGMYDRYKRTKYISEAIKSLTSGEVADGIMMCFKRFVFRCKKNIYKWLKNYNEDEYRAMLTKALNDYEKFENLRCWPYEPHNVSGIIDIACGYANPSYFTSAPQNLLPFSDDEDDDTASISSSSTNSRSARSSVSISSSTSADTSISTTNSRSEPPVTSVDSHRIATSTPISTHDEVLTAAGVADLPEDYHGTVIYSPPPDPVHKYRCGAACVAHLLSLKVSDILPAHEWWSAEDFVESAKHHNFNVFAHTFGHVDTHITSATAPTLRVKLVGSHWVTIMCGHSPYSYVVGDYKDIPIDDQYIYVNCANENLSDGAGQAKAFRTKFPDYDKGITKPVKNINIINYDSVLLAIAVANNQRSNHNVHATHRIYQQIQTELIKVCDEYNKMVMMPLLGTNIFGCNLCCFKKYFNKDPFVISFYSDRERQAYDRTKPCICIKGGYDVIGKHIKPTIVRGTYDNTYYDEILPRFTPGRMSDKAADLFKYCKDANTPGIFFEISYAPGDFAKYAMDNNLNYFAAIYKGPGHLPARYDIKPERFVGEWRTPEDLTKILLALTQNVTIINDNPCNIRANSFSTHKAILNYIDKVTFKHCYITKWMCYIDKHQNTQESTAEFLETLTGYSVETFKNEYSNPISSEAYVKIMKSDSPSDNTVLDNNQICTDIDRINLRAQKNIVCPHNDFNDGQFDFTYNISVTRHDADRFIEQLSKDKLIVSSGIKLPRLNELTMDIKVKCGVAGSAKSRGIIKQVCSACAIIIAPYRTTVEQFNSVTANCAITYVKAIDRLMNVRFRRVFIDEIFSINPCFMLLYKQLAGCDVFGIGDQNQIDDRDYNNIPATMKCIKTGKYLTKSFRTPKNIERFIRPMIPDYSAEGNIGGTLELCTDINKDDVILCHTQKALEFLRTKHKQAVYTVNGAMGSTFKCVQLYIADYKDIYEADRFKYCYVGLTRHTDKLTIIANTPEEANSYLNSLAGHKSCVPTPIRPIVINLDNAEPAAKPDIVGDIVIPSFSDTTFRDVSKIELVDTGDGVSKPLKTTRGNTSTYNILGTKMIEAIDTFGVPPHNDVTSTTKVTVRSKQPEKDKSCTNEKIDVADIEAVTNRLFPAANAHVSEEYIGIRDNLLREIKAETSAKVDANVHRQVEVCLKGGKMANGLVLRSQIGKDIKATEDASIHRYMNAGNKQPRRNWTVYYKGLCKFMDPSFKQQRNVTNERVWASVKAYLTNLSAKLGYQMITSEKNLKQIHRDILTNHRITNKNELVFYTLVFNTAGKEEEFRAAILNAYEHFKRGHNDRASRIYEQFVATIMTDENLISKDFFRGFSDLNTDWYEQRNRTISFHLKNQPKVMQSIYFDISDKVGQGISAWSKMLNIIMSTVMKAFEQDFQDHMAPNVYIASNMSDTDISRLVANYGGLYNDPSKEYINGDVSEFDSSQNEATTYMTAFAMLNAGFSEATVELMIDMRSKYLCSADLTNANEIGRLKFYVEWVMTSGALFTLIGNTVVVMAIMGMCYEIKNVYFAMFKGDDSHIVCDSYKIAMMSNRTAAEVMGHKLKIDTNRISEFIANIITPYGFYPDVIRRTMRTIGRVCTNLDSWNEIRKSIADSLDVVLYPEHLGLMHQFAVEYYRMHDIDITLQEVEMFYRFLRRCVHDPKYKPKLNRKFYLLDVDLSVEYDEVTLPEEQ